MTPLYIFDLDGTLAKIDHRLHHIRGESKRDWKKFFDECDKDALNLPIAKILDALEMYRGQVWIWSGRSDEVFHKTVTWLEQHSINYNQLRMRKKGDHTPDDQLKEAWLHSMSEHDRKRLVAVFEDRDRIVQMYRRNGVTCLQVADGNF